MPPGISLPRRPVPPLPRARALAVGGCALALVVASFLPCFSWRIGRLQWNSLGVHPWLHHTLDPEMWDAILEARRRAKDLEAWPSVYQVWRNADIQYRLDEDFRRPFGSFESEGERIRIRWLEVVFLLACIPGFVYGPPIALWGTLRIRWKGSAAVDATVLAAALFLGVLDAVGVTAIALHRKGIWITWKTLLFAVPAYLLVLAAGHAAWRDGYRRAFAAGAVLLALFLGAELTAGILSGSFE
ncbi:MAG: hypothetical protein HY720_13005 [Planctomycetes bacterium]|nr:hypothetical protein [Planctomycetota bacterium]